MNNTSALAITFSILFSTISPLSSTADLAVSVPAVEPTGKASAFEQIAFELTTNGVVSDTMADDPEQMIFASSSEQFELALHAFGRYAAAGLTLPKLDIYLHPGRQGCGGYLGLQMISAERHRLDVCVPGRDRQERVILHELAHAWTHDNLSGEEKETFMSMRGLQVWNEIDADWEQLGNEHAAEIITWGLDEKCQPPGRIGNHDPDSLRASFEFLTGTDPLCIPAFEEPALDNRRGGALA